MPGIPSRPTPKPAWILHDDGHWYPGLVRRWQRGVDGFWAIVDYHAPPVGDDDPNTTGHRYRRLPADRVRRRDQDWPVGRSGDDAVPDPPPVS